MKNFILFMLFSVCAPSFATVKKVTCTNADSKIVFQIGDLNNGIRIDHKRSKLQNELSSLESMQTLSVNKTSNGWTVVALEGTNSDDTHMIATMTLDAELKENARLSVQVLVDGLEGGTYSEAFECVIK